MSINFLVTLDKEMGDKSLASILFIFYYVYSN